MIATSLSPRGRASDGRGRRVRALAAPSNLSSALSGPQPEARAKLSWYVEFSDVALDESIAR
jgi:hypothetical protein